MDYVSWRFSRNNSAKVAKIGCLPDSAQSPRVRRISSAARRRLGSSFGSVVAAQHDILLRMQYYGRKAALLFFI